ncbi:MAG TPA: 4-alpha-glucanotransferase [Streptosporangiaceae bacterium]|nr:4-alpha-glucanotransferase [Streptosporangiaceae bacterium]
MATDRDGLARRARELGVAVSYRDWRGREVEVGTETLAAVLAALGDAARPAASPAAKVAGEPERAPRPDGRSWGFTVQLYSLRSRDSWGHGDLRDLAELAAWSGRELGAGFVLCNPLHAAEPVPPVTASPYQPMSRRFLSPLYLRVEDVPEYARLSAAHRERIDALATPLRARNATGELIDRDAVWAAKRAALEILWAVHDDRDAGQEFRAQGGQALDDWATWCALAEIHGSDWRAWPVPLHDPRSSAVAAARRQLAGRVDFHAWLQWLASEQLAAAQRACRQAGMSIGVVGDLAVGAHPGGADAWAGQDVLVSGVSVGAPPDEFNPRGQDWALPPWHPRRLAALGYRPLAGLIGGVLREAGGIRMDHVMGLLRLWWVPAGMTPDRGTYVYYDHEAMTGVLAGQAAQAGAIAIGEDLGTVAPWIRRYLATRGVLGTSMLWFERAADGSPLPAAAWRRDCLATVGTHDVPPAASFLTGEHVALRAGLGLLTRSEAAERADAERAVAAWRDALAAQGLIPGDGPGQMPSAAEFTVALYAFLARTPAALVGVSLTDAVGERRPQNLPGTIGEYPNWRIPLAGPDGRPVLADDLPAHPGIRAIAAVMPKIDGEFYGLD